MAPQNEVVYGAGFLADARKLPREVQEKLAVLLELLALNEFDPSLHTKPLGAPLRDMYSFRIMRDWRVGFTFRGPRVIHLLVADHRSRIYRRMERLR